MTTRPPEERRGDRSRGADRRGASRSRDADRSGAFDVVNPAELGEPRGWSHGLLAAAAGRVLFVAGQTARDAEGRLTDGGFVEQFAGALENVLAVVREAGGGPGSLGRLTIYVTDLEAYRASLRPLGRAYRRLMGRHYPAMALVEVGGLVDEEALVEIEATAVIRVRGPEGCDPEETERPEETAPEETAPEEPPREPRPGEA